MSDKDPDAPEPPSSPFDPPRPPQPSALETAGTIAGGVALLGVVALDYATVGILHTLDGLPDFSEPEPVDVRALERAMPGLASTAAPRFTPDRLALCTRCSAAVPYASMSLSEHGYFCAACIAALR